MSYTLYKVIHLIAIMVLFTMAGGVALHAANGGDKLSNRARGLVAALHTVALLVIVVSGFGLAARLGVGLPYWVGAKVLLWLVIGAIAYLPYRKPELGKVFLILLPALGAIGAWLALYKPF